MTKLKELKKFIQQIANAFAAVMDYEIGILDDEVEIVAGTGKYKEIVNSRVGSGCITDRLISNSNSKSFFVEDTDSNDLCNRCQFKKECPVLAVVISPIKFSGQVVGTFALMAFDETQRQNLITNRSNLITFSEKVADFLSSTLAEKEMRKQMGILADQFKAVINSVHEGIIAINAQGNITHINQSATEVLKLNQVQTGKNIKSFFPELNLERIFSDSIMKNDYCETKLKYKQGEEEFELLCNITLIKNNEQVIGATISFRGLEEMKQLATKIIAEDQQSAFDKIKGTSNEIINLKKQMHKVAQTSSTVLICGESGTGKGMFARAIHEESDRKEEAFISVNCAAIPENLLESELFGYEEGAFTGAKKGGKPGKFELAHKGTIFLDEIGDMPLHFQVKLLKVIEDKKLERVGGVESIDIDVRIIAATHQDLKKMVKEGKFRKDLFYRLNVIPFSIPPLRERKEDILLLSHFFLQRYSHLLGKDIEGFTEGAKQKLLNYSWPGNIRELENSIEYAVNIATSNYITEKYLPETILESFSGNEETSVVPTLNEVERKTIIKALQEFGTSGKGKEKAAEALGIGRSTLYRKLDDYNIELS